MKRRTIMERREFLAASAAALCNSSSDLYECLAKEPVDDPRTFATPSKARQSPPEKLAYVAVHYAGTGMQKPDYLATIDVNPTSRTYSQVIHRLPMPNVGDELHHFGWNACASCHGVRARRYLLLPGLTSSRIHVIDTAKPDKPRMHKVIESEEVIRKTKLTAPHTVHCLADGHILISMLGDENGNGPGGFLLLDEEFKVAGCWGADRKSMRYNYDFWYQPRHNVMVSSGWGAPNTVRRGFRPDDVKSGLYGRHIHFWDWEKQCIQKTVDLGEQGHLPLEVRFHHNPESSHGFVGAALSSTIWHWSRSGDDWKVEKIIEVAASKPEGGGSLVPALITDLVLSMDDRWLYFSDWLHGDVRQYDVSNPSRPRLAGQLWVGGLLGKGREIGGKKLTGGPQMLQLSLDGRRLYATSSLFSVWDNQFYPEIARQGSFLLILNCDTDQGGLTLNERFLVDFGREPDGPPRAHEIRFPYGDSTSDIWM
jgi:selenium-binding protein 1